MNPYFKIMAWATLMLLFIGVLAGCALLTTPSKDSTSAQSPAAIALAEDFTDEHGVKMRLIPAGKYQMGYEGGESDEKPVHTVYLDAFYIDIYEVTNAMYALCVEAGVCREPPSRRSFTREPYYGFSDYDDYPVIYIGWEQARVYCEWRGARLPTEAEWEKAARGGLEGKLYPWGDQAADCSRGNFSGCEGDTARVGSYPPNGYGLFDMAGNVWEWVWDWYSVDYYASSPSRNPPGAESGLLRVMRGGSWDVDPKYARAAIRFENRPFHEHNFGGFRCARTP